MPEFERRTASWEAGEEAKITGYAVVFEQRTVLYKDPATGIEYGEIIDRRALDGADMRDVVLRYNHQGRPRVLPQGYELSHAQSYFPLAWALLPRVAPALFRDGA